MKKRKKIILFIILILIFLIISGLISVYFSYLHRYKGSVNNYTWNSSDSFSINDTVILNKEKDKDFKILNLADIQLSDIEDFFNRQIIKKEIDYLINKTSPDLITLTGDQTWSNENLMSLRCLIRWLDSYKIPYAPVFGNHDRGNDFDSAVASGAYISDLYENSKYCLYKRGPNNLDSLGNYVINIMEEDKIYKTIYMMDVSYNYEITSKQIEWVKWNADNIKTFNNNEYTEGMVFMHEPINMFASAYYSYRNNEAISYTDVLVDCMLYGASDNGFYNVAKSCGIKYYTCGHQHTNSFSIPYDDCVFTFALKTGELSFYYDDGIINYNGGTLFTLSNTLNISNIYVPRDKYHIKGSTNTYCG